ncbi:capsular polysaccharide export protein, LipB/KpsS family [Roseateles chitosanitabidus]|uniref:capsular polysaccharide export protein, LipB/KpsS family n=1 Tax=Roseateles chitosanitabidus TaxID=65048 RepID=UPI00082B3F9D|nr:hypothetical protein [Roseateles chitosanitabidus]
MGQQHAQARLLIAAVYHSQLPYLWQLAHGLERAGWPAMFLAFTPRERDWLRLQGAPAWPEDPSRLPLPATPVFTDAEAAEILGFSMSKAPAPARTADWRARLERIGAAMEIALDRHRPEAVLVWNGSEFIGKALSVLAARRGARTIFMENGYFPATLQIDDEGVNSGSSMTRLPFDALRQAVMTAMPIVAVEGVETAPVGAAAPMTSLVPTAGFSRAYNLKRFLLRRFDPTHLRKYPENRGNSLLKTRQLSRRRAAVPVDEIALPERYVFIPFQVHDDTQILENSPHFRAMETFFEHCHAAIRRQFGPSIGIVVKEHPEDLFRHDYTELKRRFPDVTWLVKFNVDQLIRDCALMMVVNSSTGLQAIAAGKPVVTFGRSFYARPEICFPVDDLAATEAQLARAADGLTPQMAADAATFVDYLKQVFFISGTWSRVELHGVLRSVERVLQLLTPPRDAAPALPEDEPLHVA